MYDITPNLIIEYHQSMLNDKVRTQSFLRAILMTVNAGDIVLDIGCGTGILSYIARLAGAKRIYAIEEGPVIELAKAICQHNGYQNKVTFVNDRSTNVELPEPVDVIVTETIGNIGFEEGILGWIIDAKQRLLVEGGQIIPRSVGLVVVPIENLLDYTHVDSWSPSFYSLDFSPGRSVAANNLLWTELSQRSFLSEPATLVDVEMAKVASADIGGEASFVVKRDGVVHGLGGWFVAELTPGLMLSNKPPNVTPSWSQAFMPLELPLRVKAGDRLQVRIRASNNAAQWQWQVAFQPESNGRSPAPEVVRFEQTTLAGQLLAPVHGKSPDHMPVRTEVGEVDLFILQLMDGRTSIGEIAGRVITKFPTQFTSFEDALDYIFNISEEYGRWVNNEESYSLNEALEKVQSSIL